MLTIIFYLNRLDTINFVILIRRQHVMLHQFMQSVKYIICHMLIHSVTDQFDQGQTNYLKTKLLQGAVYLTELSVYVIEFRSILWFMLPALLHQTVDSVWGALWWRHTIAYNKHPIQDREEDRFHTKTQHSQWH